VSAFDLLLEVQDLDTAIAQLEHRRANLPERVELSSLRERLASVSARADEARARHQDLVDREDELERQIAALNERRTRVEDRLYAARGAPARDLQAMDDEVHHLSQRRSELEDVELALMEERDPVDVELADLERDRSTLDEQTGRLGTALAAAESTVDAELAGLRVARGGKASGLPTDLADRYEVLRARLRGTGAARLVGNRCEGCHLELPAVEVDRIRRLPDDVLVTCDQCGRILVRPRG
jgi:predicted  nucleic acid-binding Zn-ribbon protein